MSVDSKTMDKGRMMAIDSISKGDHFNSSLVKEEKTKNNRKENEIISEIEFLNEKAHKIEFLTNDLHEKIRKHFNVFKCPG